MRVILAVLAVIGAIGGGTVFGGGFVEPSLPTLLLMVVGGIVCVLASLGAAGLAASGFGPTGVRRGFALVGAVGAACGLVGAVLAHFTGVVGVVLAAAAMIALIGYVVLADRGQRTTPAVSAPVPRQAYGQPQQQPYGQPQQQPPLQQPPLQQQPPFQQQRQQPPFQQPPQPR